MKPQDIKMIHRNLLHRNTLVTYSQKEKLRKKISLTITSKRIKYLGINLTKKVKGLYSENYKMLTKAIEND